MQGATPPFSASAEGASREGIQRPSSSLLPLYGMAVLPRRSNVIVRRSPRFRRCSNVVRNGEAVSSLREIGDFPLAVRTRRVLTTSRESFALSNDDKKRATAAVAECRTGRSGTLRTTQRGTTPVESGTAVGTLPARSDAEAGNPDLKDRAAKSFETASPSRDDERASLSRTTPRE